MCLYGVAAFLQFNLRPNLANESTCSLPSILLWALTFMSVVVCVHDCNIWTINSMISLYVWVLCIMGHLIWVMSGYMTLGQFVKMWVGLSHYVVVENCRVWCITIIYAHRMFCRPNSLWVTFRALKWRLAMQRSGCSGDLQQNPTKDGGRDKEENCSIRNA